MKTPIEQELESRESAAPLAKMHDKAPAIDEPVRLKSQLRIMLESGFQPAISLEMLEQITIKLETGEVLAGAALDLLGEIEDTPITFTYADDLRNAANDFLAQ